VSQNIIRYLIFYNLKKPEPVFVNFGVQYPNNSSFQKHLLLHIEPHAYIRTSLCNFSVTEMLNFRTLLLCKKTPLDKEDRVLTKDLSA